MFQGKWLINESGEMILKVSLQDLLVNIPDVFMLYMLPSHFRIYQLVDTHVK